MYTYSAHERLLRRVITFVGVALSNAENYIGPAGASALAEALKTNSAITALDLNSKCRRSMGVDVRKRASGARLVVVMVL
jgi:hypothetical protein